MTNATTYATSARPAAVATLGLLFFLYFMHAISGLLLGSWLLYMFAPTGNPGAGDIFKVILLTIGITAAQIVLTTLALRFVPKLSSGARHAVTGVIAAFLLLIALFAGAASASMIGFLTGAKAYFQQHVERMIADVEHDKTIVSGIDVLIPTFIGCASTASDMLAREVNAGAISTRGRNVGPVSAELSAIQLACANAEKALLSSRALSAELFSDMDRVVARARRVVDNDELSPEAKMTALVRLSEQLAVLHKQLGQAVPVESLRPISETLNKDRAAMGLSPEAVATIQAALRPIFKAVGQGLDETIEALQKPFDTMRPVTNPMMYLGLFTGQMLTAIAIAVLLEVTPLIVIYVFLLAAMDRRKTDDDDPDVRKDGRVTYIDTARATPGA
jgi:hypothetical protein